MADTAWPRRRADTQRLQSVLLIMLDVYWPGD
jgi:hypothetical protein